METELLVDHLLISIIVLLDIHEDVLCDLSLQRSGRATKVVKVAVEPIIDFFMNRVIMIANFLGRFFLFQCLGFSCSPVFISSTNVESVVAH